MLGSETENVQNQQRTTCAMVLSQRHTGRNTKGVRILELWRSVCVTNLRLRDLDATFSRKQATSAKQTANMASTKRKNFHLFNCDNLCDLSEVESLLKAVERNAAFKISKIVKHQLSGREIKNAVEKTIPNLRGMDYAVFVVHADECTLSFNEDSGYGKIYRALSKQVGLGKFKNEKLGE